jgi:aurora kinase
MATRTLESRFEHMSVNDENDPIDGNKYQKTKVLHAPKLRDIAKKVR